MAKKTKENNFKIGDIIRKDSDLLPVIGIITDINNTIYYIDWIDAKKYNWKPILNYYFSHEIKKF